ncbi:MAG: glutamyl-tRNA reductase, partial [Chlamydiae bacterium]|nr:glutamyl-tRNA reductase [Chlamydiota bacterium]
MLQLIEHSCALQIGVLGVNFKTASLDLREKISRHARALSEEKSFSFHSAVIVLSTCNRTEIYFAGDNLPRIHGDLLALFRSAIDTPFEPHFYSYFGLDCFTHLCRVSSGLDSAIMAETEIQRQVKVAYERASQRSLLPSSLHYVFQKALKVGKEVRNQLAPSFISPSLFTAIWRLSKEFFEDLPSRKLLFV